MVNPFKFKHLLFFFFFFLRQWWNSLNTKWDEFEQHEESMEKMNELRAQQLAAQQAQMAAMARAPWPPPHGMVMQQQQQQHPQQMYTFDPNMQRPSGEMYGNQMYQVPTSSSDSDANVQHQQQIESQGGVSQIPPISEPQYMQPNPGLRFRAMPSSPGPMHVPQQTSMGGPQVTPHPGVMYSRMPEYMMNMNTRPRPAYTPILPRGPDLVRRPIHSYLASPKAAPPATPTSFRSKVMTVLGLNPYNTVPPGLRNQGQNLCFMNSVFQCLAHTSGLQACLSQHKRNPAATPPEEVLALRVLELLQLLDVAPGTSETTVVDSDKVRQAASMLPQTMVLHPQHQVMITDNYVIYHNHGNPMILVEFCFAA